MGTYGATGMYGAMEAWGHMGSRGPMGTYGAMGTYVAIWGHVGTPRQLWDCGAMGTYGVIWGHGDLWGRGDLWGHVGQLTGACHGAQHSGQLQQQSGAHPRGRRPRPQRITTRPHDDVTVWGRGQKDRGGGGVS